jgi:DNA-binding NtrC family response regulator
MQRRTSDLEHRVDRSHEGAYQLILVLHENSLMRSMFSSLAGSMGYEVKKVNDLEGARAVFGDGMQVAIVICGCHLPDGGARDFMMQLRAEGIDTPFLVVSGGSPQDHGVAEAGFEFLPLPLRKDVFEEAVRRIVTGSEVA